jgi:hypothetical protein
MRFKKIINSTEYLIVKIRPKILDFSDRQNEFTHIIPKIRPDEDFFVSLSILTFIRHESGSDTISYHSL